MAVIQSYGGSVKALDALTAWWAHRRRIGLYQNDWLIQASQGISAVVPATFSGYAGLVPLLGWTAAALVGADAYSNADPLTWTHNGGPVQCYVHGVYVVAEDGSLDWAEKIKDGPIPMFRLGGFVTYQAQFILESKFPAV